MAHSRGGGYYFGQVNKKPSLLESWWDIGFEGNGGVKKEGSVIVRENVIVPIFSTRTYNKHAKYRTMTFSLTITDPCFLAFYT